MLERLENRIRDKPHLIRLVMGLYYGVIGLVIYGIALIFAYFIPFVCENIPVTTARLWIMAGIGITSGFIIAGIVTFDIETKKKLIKGGDNDAAISHQR